MRLGTRHILIDMPQLQIVRVAKLQAPIFTEHGNTFMQIVQRFTLHGNERIIRTLERKPVGYVFIGEHDAAKSMRNLANVQVVLTSELNAYDVLVNDWIVFSQDSLPTTAGGAK
ncbi:MAG: 50S ribosomal protein L4 [Actinobacteria bacterium]|nr:50S ribosomal protein L4 [Actinomycetota bacterium]